MTESVADKHNYISTCKVDGAHPGNWNKWCFCTKMMKELNKCSQPLIFKKIIQLIDMDMIINNNIVSK